MKTRPHTKTLPAERCALFAKLSADVARQLKKKRLTEDEVLSDFSEWHKGRRATRHPANN
jgi:hypothetical protein